MTKPHAKPTGSYISYMSNMVKTSGGINLAQGLPGFAPPIELLEGLREIAKSPIHQYAPGAGDHKLVEQLTESYGRQYGFTKENFLVTCGATEALTLLFTYIWSQLNEPFAALAFDPVYESYGFLPKLFRAGFVAFPLEQDGAVDFAQLSRVMQKDHVKVMFIASPGNPYGKVFTRSEWEQILTLCEQHDCWLIIDAVYQDLYFTGEKPYLPLDRMNSKIFYVNSFSKMLCITGWRIGYIIATAPAMEKIKSIRDYTAVSSPSLLQRAIADYLAANAYGKDYIATIRAEIKASFIYMRAALFKLGFTMPIIDGGYYVWAKLPQTLALRDGFEFTMNLYQTQGVAVVPGENFSPHAQDFIRISIARPLPEIEAGAQGIIRYFQTVKS